MYVVPSLKVVYLAQPRTASRACARLLKEEWGCNPLGAGGHHAYRPKEVERYARVGYRVIVAVRNHFDIIVSWYHHNPRWFDQSRPEMRFWAFAKAFPTHARNTYVRPHQMYWGYQRIATHIIRYENLWDDFEEALGVPIPRSKVEVIGKSDRKPYRWYYEQTDENDNDYGTREFIEQYYAEELERYGYSF